jgi:hypothetical protein
MIVKNNVRLGQVLIRKGLAISGGAQQPKRFKDTVLEKFILSRPTYFADNHAHHSVHEVIVMKTIANIGYSRSMAHNMQEIIFLEYCCTFYTEPSKIYMR